MKTFGSRLRSTGLALSALAVLTGPVLAQSADAPATKPAPDTAKGGSATGVGKSPMEGTGETGNGRVINGTAGSGGTAPPGTLDKSSAGSVQK